jgi:class 3 adenylate cyclase
LQSAAAPDLILINETSYEKVEESFNGRKVGEVSLKHKADQIVVHEVLDYTERLN